MKRTQTITPLPWQCGPPCVCCMSGGFLCDLRMRNPFVFKWHYMLGSIIRTALAHTRIFIKIKRCSIIPRALYMCAPAASLGVRESHVKNVKRTGGTSAKRIKF